MTNTTPQWATEFGPDLTHGMAFAMAVNDPNALEGALVLP
jgi:hypothetical protein